MQNSTINPNDYTVIMERTMYLSKVLKIPSDLKKGAEITRSVLAEIEEKIEKYGVCILDFSSDCISQLESWENFYKRNMAYNVSRDSNTVTIQKRTNSDFV